MKAYERGYLRIRAKISADKDGDICGQKRRYLPAKPHKGLTDKVHIVAAKPHKGLTDKVHIVIIIPPTGTYHIIHKTDARTESGKRDNVSLSRCLTIYIILYISIPTSWAG